MAHVVDVRQAGGSMILIGNLVVSGTINSVSVGTASGDVAERYHADAPYSAGTVVVLGGPNEITQSTSPSQTSVAGIISTDPGLKLNSEAGQDSTHPYVALRGRVPCRVTGKISKGSLLVTSKIPGHAMQANTNSPPTSILGKAIQSFEGLSGTIEVLV